MKFPQLHFCDFSKLSLRLVGLTEFMTLILKSQVDTWLARYNVLNLSLMPKIINLLNK